MGLDAALHQVQLLRQLMERFVFRIEAANVLPGQTVFKTAEALPIGRVGFSVNGQEQEVDVDYIVDQTGTVTWISSDFSLDSSDRVQLSYLTLRTRWL
jgi:hypothetical protein